MRKPLIYVEGYDVSGKYNILNLIANDQTNIGEWYELLNRTGYDFMHYLDDVAGYDLVFVNYNTLRSFEDNSKMLQHVIEWVKQDKTAGGYTAQNVMIGTSAGGVLARYTLARMTKTISSASTDTRLLITHDSPHQGANVPLAFQHFLYDLGNVKVLGNKLKDNLEDIKNFYVLNTQPATAQLLRARVIDENGTVVMNTFLNGPSSPYQLMIKFGQTGNQPIYRFIATAQGSQCGVPVMSSNGLPLANYDGDFAIARFKYVFAPLPYTTKYFLTTQRNALPAAATVSQIEYFKYSRRFSYFGIGFGTKILKEVNRNNPAGFTQWDAAPGSTQSINDRTGGALNTGLTKQKLPWYATPFVKLRAGLNINITQDLFSFVSTTSALDAPPGTSIYMTYLFQSTGTSGTSSQKYIAQEKFTSGSITYYNQNHTDFTARNSRWIYNEMEGITQPIDCNDYCDNSSLQINGNSSFCITSGMYTINNLPSNATVTWSASPNLVQFSCNPCSQTTLTKTGNGVITLSANITGACGNITITKPNITVGTPAIPAIFAQRVGGSCYYDAAVTFSGLGTIVEFSFNNVNWQPGGQTGNTYTMGELFQGAGYQQVYARTSNSCGKGAVFSKNLYIPAPPPNCMYGPASQAAPGNITVLEEEASDRTLINIYPNPATNKVVVETPTLSNNEWISVYDMTGKLMHKEKVSKTKTVINISGYGAGVYLIRVATDGHLIKSEKVVKEK